MSENIRYAEEKDIEKCVELSVDMIREGIYKHFDIDLDDMRAHARRAMGDLYCYLVFEKDGEVVGFFLAEIEKTFFGRDWVAHQNLMYIDPAHRGNLKIPMEFMRWFRRWVDSETHARKMFFAPTVSVHDGFDIMAKRLGYDYVGPMYGRTP